MAVLKCEMCGNELNITEGTDVIRCGCCGATHELPRGNIKTTPENTVVSATTPSVESYLKRVLMFLEDGDWGNANEYCEKVLDINPENAEAYLGKLMAELNVKTRSDLKNCAQPFNGSSNYQKAVRFGNDALKEELDGYIKAINERNVESAYNSAFSAMRAAKSESEYKLASASFKKISNYKNSAELAEKCLEKAEADRIERERKAELKKIAAAKKRRHSKKIAVTVSAVSAAFIAFIIVLFSVIIPASNYKKAVAFAEDGDYDRAIAIFTELGNYKDAEDKISETTYLKAVAFAEDDDYDRAIAIFAKLGDYKDAKEKIYEMWDKIAVRETVSAGNRHTVGLKSDGTVVAVGDNKYGQCDVSDWTDIVAVSAGDGHTVGLKSDGTVVAVGNNEYGQCDVSGWTDIVAVSAGNRHTVGLKSDGTVVAVGYNEYGKCNVSGWTDIVAVSAGWSHTVGLKSDGTVVAVGDNDYGRCDVSGWTDIVAVSAGDDHTVGLKSDGTVVAVGDNYYGQSDVSDWTDIVAISAGSCHTVGLKSDGSVVATEYTGDSLFDLFLFDCGQCDVSGWTDIVAVSAGISNTVGLRSDGTVVATEFTGDSAFDHGQCDVSGWSNIKLPQ